MNRMFLLAMVALGVMAGCASHEKSKLNQTYQPATPPEKTEFTHDRLDVYPDDVRAHPAAFTNTAVAWVGIICTNDVQDQDEVNQFVANTCFEQHYFDWVQEGKGRHIMLSISPRGEGKFRARWHIDKSGPDADMEKTEKYLAKGTLAIVYGTPESVDSSGTVVLKYRYIRILNPDHYTTNEFDYGRLGEPFHVLPGNSASR